MLTRISLLLIVAWLAMGCAAKSKSSAPPLESQPSLSTPSDQAKTESDSPRVLIPFPGITVHRSETGESSVEVSARVCLDEGYLEQIACAPNSREHESLVVVTPAMPSQVHAAMLMAGFAPGKPGTWTFENGALATINPTGDSIDIRVRYTNAKSEVVEHPICQWIRGVAVRVNEGDSVQQPVFPDQPWIFGGSAIAPNPKFMGPGEHYVADMTGSVIGLVTFGDEPLGFSHVSSDQEDVQSPEWEVNTELIPPMDTPVTLILRHWRGRE